MPRLLASLALLAACTAPPETPAPTPEAVVVAPVEPAAPVAVAPAAPVAAAPSEPAVTWWCVCYSRTTATGGEPVTACRREEAECHGLERAVAAGRSGMVARSLTHRCEKLEAAHPGDVYRGRDVWQPSKRPGSWLSLVGCHLPGEGELVQADAGPDPAREENIGGLRLNMSAAEVIALLGEPGKRGRIESEEATAAFVQDWRYDDRGLLLTLGSDARKGAQSLSRFTVKPPSTFKTLKGVGIGSPRKAVLDAYGTMRDPGDPSGDADEVFVAGSIYGGVFFTFKADKVVEIFVGAGAE